jgi:ubiquinone/menaquinone biosynthesis C-methylase UbiE
MDKKLHWENVYLTKEAGQVSWYRPHLEVSLRMIDDAHLGPDAWIVDVGGGSSTLVDDLLDLGHRNITVADISEKALENVKERLGTRTSGVS